MVDVLHCSRKWAIRLLNGRVVFKGRKGRGRTYRDAEIEVIRALWRELGGLCAPYLHADLARFLRDYQELHHVPQDVAERVLRMSVSTIARAIRGQERSNSVWSKPRNKRSGKNAIRALVPIESGEDRPAHEIPPGDIQADSVALCGGNLSGDFFWVSTTVDRRLQWIEARPSFNLCAANYLPALEGNLSAQPAPPNASTPTTATNSSMPSSTVTSTGNGLTPTLAAPSPDIRTATPTSSRKMAPSSANTSATVESATPPFSPVSTACSATSATSITTAGPARCSSQNANVQTAKALFAITTHLRHLLNAPLPTLPSANASKPASANAWPPSTASTFTALSSKNARHSSVFKPPTKHARNDSPHPILTLSTLRAPPSPRRSAPPLWGRLLRGPQASLFPQPSVPNQMNNANPTFFSFGVVSI